MSIIREKRVAHAEILNFQRSTNEKMAQLGIFLYLPQR